MLSVTEARNRILSFFHPGNTQELVLNDALGRVIANPIKSGTNLPPFNNSSVDGFAVLAADTATLPILDVTADIRAGDACTTSLHSGEAARIMTGAPVPSGADAVVMVEDTDFAHQPSGTPAPRNVTIFKAVRSDENIRFEGEDIRSGDEVLPAGRRLRAQELGLLAMLGIARVSVYRKPRIALLSTGDELLPVDQSLLPGKIHDANSHSLWALAQKAGAEVIFLGIARDDESVIHSKLEQAVASEVDLIITSAGVSVGAYDFVKKVIEAEGELEFWKVNMRPGKPLAFGRFRNVPVMGLPGNPVSAFIGFKIFIDPVLGRLSGLTNTDPPLPVARLAEAVYSDGRESYLRAIVTVEDGKMVAHLAESQGSANIFSLVKGNALLIVPSGVKSLPESAEVKIWLID